ncbi:zinc-ribbon and DUF3426 domain-containing protein [Caldimonas sp. KR1-144]|uniref:zinc-ribbon and DUF3426 domain-containing protein n=1 Tax=Caldimonas sp. KR1-144 TaxID=3400911 RepID=UPI003C01843A
MSLATRCPSCGTIFRVVQDQLKVSEGWVRCGRCSEVFNALDGLFDLDREPPPARSAPATTASPPAAATAPKPPPAPRPGRQEFVASRVPEEQDEAEEDAPAGAVDIDSFASTVGFRREDSVLPQPEPAAAQLRAARQAGTQQEPPDFADARFPSELPLDSAIDLPEHEHDAITLDDPLSRFVPDDAPISASFIEAAERQERRERPAWRRIRAAFAFLLLLLLSLQVAVHWRDRIALEWPETRPLLEAICEPLACRIEPLRSIESFFVEGSALNRIADGSGYRLEVTLRNRSHLPLAAPAVDLNLTDGSGDTLARRALNTSEFQLAAGDGATAPAVVPPGAELHLQLAFTTPLPRIAGYTVELFYP